MKYIKNIMIVIFIFSILTGFQNCSNGYDYNDEVEYTNPSWAPTYSQGVKYYYIPDIEVYYDLSGQEFVYLDNGQWYFSHSFPSEYSWFDLNNSFVVALDHRNYQPWMHHHYFVSHYPRYYYHNRYQGTDFNKIRGFNENNSRPILRQERTTNSPLPTIRREQIAPVKKPEYSHESQRTNYYGKDIGQPVKVRPNA